MMIFLAVIMLITGLPLIDNGENVAHAAPSYKNPDASGNGISHIKKSDFTGTGYNKSRGIHPGDRGEGYTCWANGNVNKNIKSYSNKFFNGNKNRSGGRGNEAFVETHGLMKQCVDGKKLLEYEIYAGDAYKDKALDPIVTRSGNLVMWGWSALGGYDHHFAGNSSAYAVAVEQVNGKNTTKTDGVHITKAGKRKVDMTHALSYGGLETCYGDATNRFRGSYLWSSPHVSISYLSGFPFKGKITDKSSAGYGNVYDTYGAGCNFNYREAGFVLNVDLDALFKDKTEKKEYKMYLVKRVNDMIVSAEMAIPNDTTSYDFGYGKLDLDGHATPGNNQITVNRTGVPKCGDFKWGIGCQDRDGNGFFKYGQKVTLLNIQSIDGNASIYTVRASNGKVYKHLSNYFSYANDNRGAILAYTPETVKVDVNHIDLVSCPTSVDGKKWSDLRVQNMKDCTKLKEKSTGKIAKKGTKELPMKSQFKFYTYKDGELYKNNRKENYRLYDSKSVMANRYTTFRTGVVKSTINFFYVNQADLHTVRVNYRDVQTGNYLYGKYKGSKDRINGYMQFNNVLSGRTVNYKNPETVIGNDGRLYERTSDSNRRTSLKVTGNTTLNINYRKQPIVEVRYINQDTGVIIRKTTRQMKYGEDFAMTAPNSIRVSGQMYYHYNVDKDYRLNNVTRDRVVNIYYKDSAPLPYPEDRYDFYEQGTEGGADIGNFGWRLNENRLETTLGLTFDGEHADAEPATIKQYVGKNSMPTSGSYNNNKGMYKQSTANVMNKDTFKDTNDFNKNVLDKYLVNVKYDYTNVIEENYLCDDGVEERCFDWVIDKDNPSDPYWGENGETVKIDGSNITPRQTYTGNLELGIENSLGEEFDLEDIPNEMIIGKGLDGGVSLYNGGVSNNTINESHPSVGVRTEEVNIEPNEIEDLNTQTSVEVLEKILYDNSFDENLPKPKEDSRYLIGNIDKNLSEELDTETVEEKDYAVSNLRLDGDKFKLDNVFALSSKYGVQFVEDYTDVSEGEGLDVLRGKLSKELTDLNLGADKVVNLNYSKSRYFIPVDDVKYNSDYIFKDLVELNSLGLNEITVNYDKEFEFDKYLYGNVMDEPVYSEQKDSVKKEDYKGTEEFTQEELVNLESEPERTDKFNLFRATDDEKINSIFNN